MSDEPTLIDVDLPGGVKIKLPKDEADKVIAGRQKLKEESGNLAARLGALEAEKNATEAARKKLEDDNALMIASKAGEIENVRKIAAREPTEKLAKLASKYRDTNLESRVRALDGVVPGAVADIVSQLKGSCAFNLDTEQLEVMDAAGKPLLGEDQKPVSADAHIQSFLATRPHYRLASNAPGTGGAGKGADHGKIATITVAEYDAAGKDPGRSQAIAQQIAAGKLKVI